MSLLSSPVRGKWNGTEMNDNLLLFKVFGGSRQINQSINGALIVCQLVQSSLICIEFPLNVIFFISL